eukprot:COSAG01_NODE_4318_length_5137_cov_14.668718_4_plen_302_part_00
MTGRCRYNHPFWATTAPSTIKLSPLLANRSRSWRADTVKGSVVRMLHPGANECDERVWRMLSVMSESGWGPPACVHAAGWGGWAFEVAGIETGGGSTVRHGVCSPSAPCLRFSRGGNQEARGNKGCGAMYIEGILEELDDDGEWYLDDKTGLLSLIPPAGLTLAELQRARVEAPRLQTLVELRGSAARPVTDVRLSGFNVTGAAQTFLENYEAPSGGTRCRRWSLIPCCFGACPCNPHLPHVGLMFARRLECASRGRAVSPGCLQRVPVAAVFRSAGGQRRHTVELRGRLLGGGLRLLAHR